MDIVQYVSDKCDKIYNDCANKIKESFINVEKSLQILDLANFTTCSEVIP